MANELSAMGPGTVTPIVPRNIGEVFQLAEAIVNAQMSPPGLGTPQQVTVAIMQGMEVGMTPMAAVQSIAVINGRPSLYGDGLLGVVRASGLLEDLEETFDEEAMTATCSAKRKEQKTPIVRSFGKEDAIKAGLWIDDDEKDFKRQKSPWFKYRQRMCQMRARAWCLRDGFADALKGLSSAEEERDRMKDITPEVSIVGEKLTGGGGGFDAQQVDDEIEALTDPPQDAVTFEKTAGWGVIDKTVVFDATETEVTVEVGSDDAIEDTAEAHQQPEEVAEAPEPAKEEPTAGEPEVAEDFPPSSWPASSTTS